MSLLKTLTISDKNLQNCHTFEYASFDSVVLRRYIQKLFVEGSVINIFRILGFKAYSNGVMRILTDKLNAHIEKLLKNVKTKKRE